MDEVGAHDLRCLSTDATTVYGGRVVASSFKFEVGSHGPVTALVYRAKDPKRATLVLAHGAGAPQTHPFMVDMAKRVSARGVDVVTFNFVYTERGRKMPDRNELLEACWRAAIASVRARVGLPTSRLVIGGKSMGGRIASQIAASADGSTFDGLVLLGYPLHPPGKPKVRRDEHLPKIPIPTLFVQGTRDDFGTPREIAALVKKMQDARLHRVDGGDHSLALLKREGAERQEKALASAADDITQFVLGA